MNKLLLPVVLFVGSALLYFSLSKHPFLFGMPQWMLMALLAVAGLLFVLIVVSIRNQRDENPYYADMVRAKRDEVHRRQQKQKRKKLASHR